MFKRFLALFVVFVLCFSLAACNSSGEEEVNTDTLTPIQKIEQSVLVRPNKNEDFRYNVYTHYIEITECLSTKTHVIIPDTIQGLPVYKIAMGAFQNQTTFSSLEISNNIIEIGERAFENCTALTYLDLSDNLSLLGVAAFAGCEQLKEIEIPSTLLEIPGDAFANCTRLISINILPQKIGPEELPAERTIYGGAFVGCEALKIIYIPADVSLIEEGAFSFNQELYDSGVRLMVCGKEESQAANFAAVHLLDFKTENEFKSISQNLLATQSITVGEVASSLNWKMSLKGYETITDSLTHISGNNEITETINPNETILFIKMLVENASGQTQNINHLDFKVEVDGYLRKLSTYSVVKNIDYNNIRPIQGEYDSGKAYETYLAVRVPINWQKVNITYTGDLNLESYVFTLNNNANIVVPIIPEPETPDPEIVITPSTENTKTPDETTTTTTTQASETTTTTTKPSVPESTTKVEMSTLPF